MKLVLEGIPVLVSQMESLVANNTKEIIGILNGTTNFILTLMENENLDFDEALTIADGLGYVEADPSLDLDGIDAAHKICILAQNGFKNLSILIKFMLQVFVTLQNLIWIMLKTGLSF